MFSININKDDPERVATTFSCKR